METERSFEAALEKLRAGLAGRGARIATPFGSRLVCYADLTATGRVFAPVEAYVAALAPYYANSHTLISSTGAAMTAAREQARAAIARSVNAGPDDAVLFVGSGATAAVNKLVVALGLRDRALAGVPERERPVVFVGPYEHHSNELPWLESFAECVEIALGKDGQIDLADLERALTRYAGRAVKLGAFSACSNVTGVLTDVSAVARLLHRHGALAVFDYAASGPYSPIDLHPAEPDAHLDAIFLSPHKFVGGASASGVLVASRRLFRSATPERPGGGTVDYVQALSHAAVDYSRHLEEREEGGTPAILGDVRAGAALALKDWLGAPRLFAFEQAIARRALERLARHPRIRVLGPPGAARLPILSFNVVLEGGERLHHDFVSTLLDHLFGIQNRAGCACAGPYGHRLLGIDAVESQRYRAWVRRGVVPVKPGWVRVTLPFYAPEAEVEFILRAIELVADRGHSFLPLYAVDWATGLWRHDSQPASPCGVAPLSAEALFAARAPEAEAISDAAIGAERERYLDDARALADALDQRHAADPPRWNPKTGDAELDAFVWFRYARSVGASRQ